METVDEVRSRDPSLDWSQSDATRHLCAAPHVDEEFTRQALQEVMGQTYRAVAPSSGIDVVPILAHCIIARRRRAVRNLVLVLLIVAGLLVSPIATLNYLLGLWLAHRLIRGWRGRRTLGNILLIILIVLILMPSLLLLPVLLAVGVQRASASAGLLSVVAAPVAETVGIAFKEALPILLLMWVAVLVEMVVARNLLSRRLRRSNFEPWDVRLPDAPEVRSRLVAIEEQQRGNVSVYGRFSPFIGAGDVVSLWSFPVDLEAAPADASTDRDGSSRNGQVQPVDEKELRKFVTKRLHDLASQPPDRRYRLSGITVEDRLFINGTLLASQPELLAPGSMGTRPHVSEEELDRLRDPANPAMRRYTCVRVSSWNEEVVLSVFLHFATEGRTLYTEATICLLGPTKREYQRADLLPSRWSVRSQIRIVGSSLLAMPTVTVRSPLELARFALWWARTHRDPSRARKALKKGMGLDYGATASIRELGMSDVFLNLFQRLDAEKHWKLVTIHTLKAIVDFLKKHGVDTTSYEQRQTAILNYGIIISGGSMQAEAVAVGNEATAIVTRPKPTPPTPPTPPPAPPAA